MKREVLARGSDDAPRGQRPGQPHQQSLRFHRQLSPRDADHEEACSREKRVPATVALEGSGRGMKRTPVHLHDHPLGSPQEIDLGALDERVRFRPTQLRGPNER